MRVFGVFLVVLGICVGFYLGIYYMLYGGLLQVINYWGIDNGMVVWGIIRAMFFEVGCLLGYPLILLGVFYIVE